MTDDTLHAAFQALQDERAASWTPTQLAANTTQRRTLVSQFNPAAAIRVGDRLADAELVDIDGGIRTLDALVGPGLAVLIVFRFATCPADRLALPYYDRQLRPALNRLGVPLVAISPQVPDRLASIREVAPGLTIASDPDNAFARHLGILFTPDDTPADPPVAWIGATTGTGTWELPMPTVLVVDGARVVRFVHVSPDWLDRPEAAEIAAAVTAIQTPARDAA